MPLNRRTVMTAGERTINPFVGPVDHPISIEIDPGNFTTAEVDANGFLKPGIPLAVDGTLVGVGEAAFGVVAEAVKIAEDNAAATLAAAANLQITVFTFAMVNRDALEDLLGRALTADEIAGFASSQNLVLTPT